MREILFRGKTFDGEWEEGSLHIEYGETTADGKRTLDYRILGMRGECRYVDPETVGQHTGLCDKNGKKIFEGDIVRRNAAPMAVAWDSFDGNFITECFIDDVRCVNTLAGHSKLEVIGNIHDNPELLEVDNGT